MNKLKAKIFTIFWLISGTAWVIASIKRFVNGEDIVILYIITAIASFLIAFKFYRHWKK